MTTSVPAHAARSTAPHSGAAARIRLRGAGCQTEDKAAIHVAVAAADFDGSGAAVVGTISKDHAEHLENPLGFPCAQSRHV